MTEQTIIDQKVAVPSYFYPGPLWTTMEGGFPTVGLAIINPDSGPGTSPDLNYANQVTYTKAAGITVVCYVSTSYAGTLNPSRTLEAAKLDVDKYYSWYPGIDGIFVDEVSTDCGKLDYYRGLYDRIKMVGGQNARIVLNSGTNIAECYMSVGDIIVNFEDAYSNYVNWVPKDWVWNYSASRFWHIVHGTSQDNLPQVVELSRKRNAGWVYVTDKGGDNPYDTLPSYWCYELSL